LAEKYAEILNIGGYPSRLPYTLLLVRKLLELKINPPQLIGCDV